MGRITRAGVPPTSVWGGTSRVTTDPAATTAPLPIRTPSVTTAPTVQTTGTDSDSDSEDDNSSTFSNGNADSTSDSEAKFDLESAEYQTFNCVATFEPKLTDRYGLTTHLASMTMNDLGSVIVGGSHDGDIFVWHGS